MVFKKTKNKNIYTLSHFYQVFFLLSAAVIFSLNLIPLKAFALDANGVFCTDNSTCDSGYCNTTDEICDVPPNNNGASCSSPSQCSTNHQTCVNGSCQIGVLNNPCSRDINCQEGLFCVSGTCQKNSGSGAGTGSGGSGGGGGTGGSGGPITCTKGPCPDNLCYVNGLCLPDNPNKTGLAASTSLTDLILKVIQALLAFAGLVAVVFIIIGGYFYMASGGNEETAEKGKSIISNFVIGLVVIILAFTIVTILSATLTGNGGKVQLTQ